MSLRSAQTYRRSLIRPLIRHQTHQQWKALINNASNDGGIDITNTTVEGTVNHVSAGVAKELASMVKPFDADGPPLDSSIDKNHFVML